MRSFEFRTGELEDRSIEYLLIDLDSIVSIQRVTVSADMGYRTKWFVSLANGPGYFVTEAGFNRLVQSWKA